MSYMCELHVTTLAHKTQYLLPDGYTPVVNLITRVVNSLRERHISIIYQ